MRKNELGGNGSAVKPGTAMFSNDFGVGVISDSTDNLVEENAFGGNVNGVFLSGANTHGNKIRENVFTGNPPIQIETTFGPMSIGFDIQDLTPDGTNVFRKNLCRTYFGDGPNPCLKLPKLDGDRSVSQGSPPVRRK